MADEITLQLSLKSRDRALGKLIVTVLIGVLSGITYQKSTVANYAYGKQVTVASYTANFDAYKANLLRNDWPWWGNVSLMAVMVVAFFGVYELLSFVMGWTLGKFSRSPRVDRGQSG